MLTVICFLWFDPNGRHSHLYSYTADYANRLRNMLARHLTMPHEVVCVADDPTDIDPRVRVVELPPEVKALGAEFPKLWAFHPDAAEIFGGRRLLMLDLDLVIVGSIDEIVARSEPFVAWSVPDGNAGRFNTSVVLMDAGEFSEVWSLYDPITSPQLMRGAGLDGLEQDWVSYVIGERGARWARRGEGIEPFQQIRRSGLPESGRIVAFNGHRSPAMPELQAECPWIRRHWQ